MLCSTIPASLCSGILLFTSACFLGSPNPSLPIVVSTAVGLTLFTRILNGLKEKLYQNNCKMLDIPAGTWCKNDVISTSVRRDYVASTSIRRKFGTKCPLDCSDKGDKWNFDPGHYCRIMSS